MVALSVYSNTMYTITMRRASSPIPTQQMTHITFNKRERGRRPSGPRLFIGNDLQNIIVEFINSISAELSNQATFIVHHEYELHV